MRKVLFLIISVVLFASTDKIEQEIFATIIEGLYPHKESVRVWSDDPKKRALLVKIAKVSLVKQPNEAEILFLKRTYSSLPAKALLFAIDYKVLKAYRERVVGGFYWQKGRPNLIFFKQELHTHHIELPKEMQVYVESRAR